MQKTVLITGANRGIGLELVKHYAQAGCAVLACCRNPQTATELTSLSQAHSNITIYPLDVNNEADINALAQQLQNAKIDILFNNAGVSGQDNAFGHINSADLLATYKVNTVAPVLMTQAFVNQVAQSHSKIIVNISSFLGSIQLHNDAGWFWLSYRLSKSALNSATRALAHQLKSKEITVLAMHPGWVQTDMGGANAEITTEKSVQGMASVVEKATLKDSGHFVTYDGKTMPW